jgi:hypothetical protein
MCKWEAHYTQYGPPGRPFEYHEYPARMYRPSRDTATGRVSYEAQNAGTDTERESLERQGYVYGGQGEALKALEAREFEIAELAASRAYTDRKMSPEARAEADRADRSTSQHLAEIPVTPTKRRGRPAKTQES